MGTIEGQDSPRSEGPWPPRARAIAQRLLGLLLEAVIEGEHDGPGSGVVIDQIGQTRSVLGAVRPKISSL